MAGHETTALTMFWSAYLLSLAPEVQELVAAEAAAVDLSPEHAAAADGPPAADQGRGPGGAAPLPAGLHHRPHGARARTSWSARRCPAGSLVVMAPWILHRHRKRWPHPERFDPTRFLPGAPPPDRFAYLPFGVGPRVCIGAQFALIEATLVLARLVKAFRLEIVGPKRVTPVAVVTTVPDRAPVFRLVPRPDASAT